MRSIRLTGLLSVFTAISTAWAVSVPALATAAGPAVTCGQTLTASTRLTHDLTGCTGTGLVIGADSITVDLGGHTVSGVNATGSEGIADDGHRGVRIVDGTIAGFFVNGIGLRGAPGSVVSHVRVHDIGAGGVEGDASAGILVKDSQHSWIGWSTVRNAVHAYQSDGIDVLGSPRTALRGDRLLDNAWDGTVVLDSPDTRIVGNVIAGSGNQGAEVNAGSDGTALVGNDVHGNASNGLTVGAVSGVRVERNALWGNHDSGLFFFDLHDSRVALNRATGNDVGIDLEGGQHGSTRNCLLGNQASGNAHAGIVVADGADHNTVIANRAFANRGAPGDGGGVIVAAATGNTLQNNVAIDNRDVGIGVLEDNPGDSTGNVLTANLAISNRNHGIVVVVGTVDGGLNQAHHNTPLPNCVGVRCR